MSDDLVGSLIVTNQIGRLTKTIKELDEKNTKLQKTMMALTIVTAILACIQAYPIIRGLFTR